VITPDIVIQDGLVTITGSKITAVAPFADAPRGLKFVQTESYILPGFIDVHDHLPWNFLPRWYPKKVYKSREEWRQVYSESTDDERESITQSVPNCVSVYGEVKAIVGGATSTITGGIDGMARNLDQSTRDFEGGHIPTIHYVTFPFQPPEQNGLDPKVAGANLDSGDKYIIHAGEGTDAASAEEFQKLVAYGLLRRGVSVIHGISFDNRALQLMSRHQVGLIWSPRSEMALYHRTANVQFAKSAGVDIALAPDWSVTGSDGLLQELNYAASWDRVGTFSAQQLISMVTVVPAKLAGLSDLIGSLIPGHYADLLLIRRQDGALLAPDHACSAVVHARPADISLVMVGGAPVYGDQDLMNQLHVSFEPIVVCGKAKALNMTSWPFSTALTFQKASDALDTGLKQYKQILTPLGSCEE